ncbi:zinc transport system substrate-binding protein [Plasticicumulans lactativorans]|uniref:High-affinity zinc uptake system protein ZnuA n=1 Tax=Plasticicumulans lactativorans TaxID=1133106 RepID=A0A4R2LAA0_9GAMM|nr:zinc ABC transporter substrate-binding protein [Plasticicumulans lactativorans]TCO83758.1 zinc transport system substrate-binding protein [Plasticicumulans lactativorans]
MPRSVKPWLAALLLALPLAAAAAPRVLATIKPVQSLAAGVMAGVGEPKVLVSGRASEHDFSLRPSDMRAITEADLVLWIGPSLEGFMIRPLAAHPQVRAVALLDAPGIDTLAPRAGGAWEVHEHGAHDDHDHDDHDGAGHGAQVEPHIWLDPRNAQAITRAIAAALSERDPANGATYARNAEAQVARLAALEDELAARLAPLRGRPFVVFHDAYAYFERRFDLTAVGSITVSPERKPSAQRIQAIRQKIRDSGARCVFSEPQFDAALVATLVEDTGVHRGELDPTGTDAAGGADAYFTLLRRLAAALAGCLGDA